MQYLITTKDHEPFLTKWFEPENNFNPDVEMVVYDLYNNTYTSDGVIWLELNVDHL
jgi:hypothetical protein